MKAKLLITAMALAGAVAAAEAAPPIDFSGYLRAGTGLNVRGGRQVCFGLAGADTKYRLGNECDYVIEPNFNAKLADFEGSDWHVHIMPTNVYYDWGDGAGQADHLITRFNQVYTYGDHIAALGNGKVWAGRRFYNRLQTGINDQFLENNDGDGGGLEDIDVGIGKLSVAFIMNPNDGVGVVNPVNDKRYALPIRLTGIKDTPNGELAFYVTPSKQTKSTNQLTAVDPASQDSGLAVAANQTFNGMIMGGNTLIGVKYDKQGETKNARVVFQQSANFGATGVDFITEYRKNTQAADAGNKWFTIGARADTHLSGPFRFLAELGHDMVTPDNGSGKQNLTKLTLALAASGGADAGSRPTVRLFLTHALWNDAARTGGLRTDAKTIFGDKTSGTSIGVQGETWW